MIKADFKKILRISLVFSLAVILFGSCVPKRKLMYLQDEDRLNLKDSYYNIPPSQRLKPHDNIYIKVLSIDREVKELFMIESNGLSNDESDLLFYELSDSGYIDFPFARKVNLMGLNIEEAKEKLYQVLKEYITDDFALHVKMANTRITVLGEVRNPGTFSYYKDPLTVFQAIGIAGGIEAYGNRESILIIREENNQLTYNYIDLTEKNIAGSKFFYLRPDDTVIVEPVRAKFYNMGPINYSNVLSTITTAMALIIFLNQVTLP